MATSVRSSSVARDLIAALRAHVVPLAKGRVKLSTWNNALASAVYGKPYSAVIAAERAGKLPSPFAPTVADVAQAAIARLTLLANTPAGGWDSALRDWVRETGLASVLGPFADLGYSEDHIKAIAAVAAQDGAPAFARTAFALPHTGHGLVRLSPLHKAISLAERTDEIDLRIEYHAASDDATLLVRRNGAFSAVETLGGAESRTLAAFLAGGYGATAFLPTRAQHQTAFVAFGSLWQSTVLLTRNASGEVARVHLQGTPFASPSELVNIALANATSGRYDASDLYVSYWNGRDSTGAGWCELAVRVNGDMLPACSMASPAALMALLAYDDTVPPDAVIPLLQTALVTRKGNLELNGGLWGIRVSTMPVEGGGMPSGFRAAVRLSPPPGRGLGAGPVLSLPDLGFRSDQVAAIRAAALRASGLILFCGHGDAGKYTTLKAAFGVTRQARPLATLAKVPESALDAPATTTAQALAAVMHDDPDVIAMSELGSLTAVNGAIQAVRAGHLVFASLFASSAFKAFGRLIGMGAKPLDVAGIGIVSAIVYQDLVQVLCQHCRIPAGEVTDADSVQGRSLRRLRSAVAGDLLGSVYFRNPAGCQHCGHRGITGRTACAEVLVPTPALLGKVAVGDWQGAWAEWLTQRPSKDVGPLISDHVLQKVLRGDVAPDDAEARISLFGSKPTW